MLNSIPCALVCLNGEPGPARVVGRPIGLSYMLDSIPYARTMAGSLRGPNWLVRSPSLLLTELVSSTADRRKEAV